MAAIVVTCQVALIVAAVALAFVIVVAVLAVGLARAAGE